MSMLRQASIVLCAGLVVGGISLSASAQTQPSLPLNSSEATVERSTPSPQKEILDLTDDPTLLEGSDARIVLRRLHEQPIGAGTEPLPVGTHIDFSVAKSVESDVIEIPSDALSIRSEDAFSASVNSSQMNLAPIGTPDNYAVAGDQTLSVATPGFLGNDIDVEGEALTATVIFDYVDNGSLSAFPNGSFTYTPNAGFTGTDSFQYRFRDASFNVSDPVTVTIEVLDPANRAPIGTPDEYAMLEGTTLSVSTPGFLGNDIDLDGEALTATVIFDYVDNGALSAFPNGSFTYTPNAGFTGTDSFQYRFRDASFNTSAPVTVTIHVYRANRDPVGVDDAYAMLVNTSLSIAAPGFLGNDIDLDGEALTATVIFDYVDNGSLSAFPNGSFTYTPNAGFTGIDSFQYRFRDASFNTSAPVTVSLNVIDPNAPPVEDCTVTTITESAPYRVGDVHKVDLTFSNLDGITQIAFSLLENFVVASSDFSEIDPSNDLWAGGPLPEVEMTLTQADASVRRARYFAVASSICPSEDDGLLETEFDPAITMPVIVPEEFALEQNYPNPFNPSTTIGFSLPEASEVRLVVYDVRGREVKILVDGALDAGRYEAVWDGRDASGVSLASGVFFYRFDAGTFSNVGRMTLMK